MTTDYYPGNFNNQFNAFYPPQPSYSGQTYPNPQAYTNNYTAPNPNATYYGQNSYNASPGYNVNYNMNTGYPGAYGTNFGNVQAPQFMQQQQQLAQQQQRPKSAPQQNTRKYRLPLEIRGGKVFTGCHCAKKNGLQDHCGRSVCRVENDLKRRRKLMWQEYPTKDTNHPASMTPSGDANNLIVNPDYMEGYDTQMVPSNAQPVPVSYNYGM